ncbi:MAG: UDP-glucose 4-epimerase GalE [Chloroflexi bacterium]|nr:UDP-glucose 4-epimerase GalE [Chloroflexota bacterium]
MNILVTGGAGYIGSMVVERLLDIGYTVIVIDNLQEGNLKAVLPEARFYQADFGDKEVLGDIFQKHSINVVFHFAAETTIEFSMTDPGRYFTNNMVKGITLLDIMRQYNCDKFIFSSTAATFGEPEYVPIDENHPQRPINAYGESKLMFEKILGWYHQAYGLKFNAFRYFNAAGASKKLGEAHKSESHLIPIVVQVALGKREHIKVFGTDYSTKDGTCIRDYIHVLDLAEAHILGLSNLDKHPTGKYNLGNGEGFSVLEVIEMVSKVSEVEIPRVKSPRRSGDPAVLIASSELAKHELGWKPKYDSLEEIVRSAWEWHKNHPNGYKD